MSDTATKLTYLNTTKTLIKEKLNLGGANITTEPFRQYKSKLEGIYKDFLANGTDTLWNNWEKVNGTGESITLNNTIEAKMDFVYKGNTYQYSTSGKNLINDYDLIDRWHIASVSDNLLTTTATSSDWDTFQPITRNQTISLVQGTEYYVSFDMRLKSGTYSGKVGKALIIDTAGNGLATNERTISQPTMTSSFQRMVFKQTANTTTDIRIGLMIQIQYGANNAVFEIKNIMISTSSDTTYEEYTGNQPSPSPDYPQNIQVVSGDNTIKVEGKNLINDYDLINRYNIASISDNILTTNAIKSDYSVFQPRTKTQKIDLVENTKYYVSFDCRLKSGTYSEKLGVSIINGIDATSYSTGNTAISNPNMSSLYQRYSYECISNITTNSVLGIQIQVRTGLSNAVFEIKNIMIATSSDTTYEPYQSASYPIYLGVENMFDKSTATLGYRLSTTGENYSDSDYYVSSLIKVKPNTTYTKNSPIANAYHRVAFYSTNSLSGFISVKDDNNTFTTPSTCEYIKLCGLQTEIDNAKLTKGDHIQYISANPIELCKIGDYQDKIYKDNGKWYLNKQIGKVVLDGSESSWTYTSVAQGSLFRNNIVITNAKNDKTYTPYSNNYKGITEYSYQNRQNNQFYLQTTSGFLDIIDNRYTNTTDFKTWLSTHNTTVYYVLATPTTTEITDTTLISQLEAIKKSYNTQTNISQENNDLPFELDVVALGELESV